MFGLFICICIVLFVIVCLLIYYDLFGHRTLLIREALIFLNRLVCNPAYSTAVLQVLTSSREMASLTMDIGNRVFQRGRWRMRESEIVDLARVFRKRVFSYLGDRLS